MGLTCKLIGHNWQNGRCKRCDDIHEKHQWDQLSGKCLRKCSVCGLTEAVEHQWMSGKCKEVCAVCGEERQLPHQWNGCKCVVCGTWRDAEHQMRTIEDCYEQCDVCGARKRLPHKYQVIPNRCIEKCIICGEEHQLEHQFENGVCTECGISLDEYYTKCAIETFDQNDAIRYIEKIKSQELMKKAMHDRREVYVSTYCINHHYITSDEVLFSIASDNTFDYEVRFAAKGEIKDDELGKKVVIERDALYEAMCEADNKTGM